MAYDESVAQRVRAELDGLPGLVEKKMFGGVGFIVQGNMAVGVHDNDLIVRVGAAQYAETLAKPHVKVFDMTGLPMQGWVLVSSDGIEAEEDLKHWIEQGVTFALSLPPK